MNLRKIQIIKKTNKNNLFFKNQNIEKNKQKNKLKQKVPKTIIIIIIINSDYYWLFDFDFILFF